jgi:hypothetical protein
MENNSPRQVLIPQKENDVFRYDLKLMDPVELATRRLNYAQDILVMRLSDHEVVQIGFWDRMKIYNENVEVYNKMIKEYEADNTVTETLENGVVISISSRIVALVQKIEASRRALSESQHELAMIGDAIKSLNGAIEAYKVIINGGVSAINTEVPEMPEMIKYPQDISNRAFGQSVG